MVIKSIKIQNFKGIENAEYELPKLWGIAGENGAGKTSIMQAIRFAISGDEPDGAIVKNSADEASVELFFSGMDGNTHSVTRTVRIDKPSKFYLDGKPTTKSALSDFLSHATGIPQEARKTALSSEVLAAMVPKELAGFLLHYIPKPLKVEDIIALVPECSENMTKEIRANLPAENIMLEDLNDFLDNEKEERKSFKKVVASDKAVLATLPAEKPEETEEALKEREDALHKEETRYQVYLRDLQEFERNSKKREEAIELYKKQRDDFNANKATMPSMDDKTRIESAIRKAEETVRNLTGAKASAETTVKTLERTLAALAKPVCPISPMLTCTTDKTVVRESLEKSVAEQKDGIEKLDGEIRKASEAVETGKAELSAWSQNAILYQRKAELYKSMQLIERQWKEAPKKPDEVKKPETAEELQKVRDKLHALELWAKKVTTEEHLTKYEAALADCEKLVKAFDDKGVVKAEVIRTCTEFFSKTLNGIADENHKFEFRVEDGLRLYMDDGNGFLPFESLSGGEKAYELSVLMEMLAALTGTRIVMLDETSVMDNDVFRSMVTYLSGEADDRDHVIINTLPEKERIDILAENGFSVTEI